MRCIRGYGEMGIKNGAKEHSESLKNLKKSLLKG